MDLREFLLYLSWLLVFEISSTPLNFLNWRTDSFAVKDKAYLYGQSR